MARKPRAEMIEETRAKLIDAARRAFTDNGYAGASMDELTASAGLTRGALYHHFGDKKGLLAAVVQQIDDEMNLRLTASEPAATRTPRCSRPSSAQPGKASACCPSWPGSPTPGSPGWTSIAA